MNICQTCSGLILELAVRYGYTGNICYCPVPNVYNKPSTINHTPHPQPIPDLVPGAEIPLSQKEDKMDLPPIKDKSLWEQWTDAERQEAYEYAVKDSFVLRQLIRDLEDELKAVVPDEEST